MGRIWYRKCHLLRGSLVCRVTPPWPSSSRLWTSFAPIKDEARGGTADIRLINQTSASESFPASESLQRWHHQHLPICHQCLKHLLQPIAATGFVSLCCSNIHNQCDQMVRLFFNIWPFEAMKISQIMSHICQSMRSILPNKKWTVRHLPSIWKHFAKSGHTVLNKCNVESNNHLQKEYHSPLIPTTTETTSTSKNTIYNNNNILSIVGGVPKACYNYPSTVIGANLKLERQVIVSVDRK